MRVALKRTIVVLSLVVGLTLAGTSPALGAVGAVRIEGADRYETSARTALTAY